MIPNAVDSDVFRPDFGRPSPPPAPSIVVVIGSRLVYRKGIDLVTAIVPRICARTFGKYQVRKILLKTCFFFRVYLWCSGINAFFLHI